MRRTIVSTLIAAQLVGACAGPVRTHFAGTTPLASAPVLAGAEARARQYWPQIEQALHENGIVLAPDAAAELEFSVGTRPASVALVAGDAARSGGKKRRALQSCPDALLRVVMAVTDRGTGKLLARGWAEEAHCHATTDDVVPALAARAARMLVAPVADGTALRAARD